MCSLGLPRDQESSGWGQLGWADSEASLEVGLGVCGWNSRCPTGTPGKHDQDLVQGSVGLSVGITSRVLGPEKVPAAPVPGSASCNSCEGVRRSC